MFHALSVPIVDISQAHDTRVLLLVSASIKPRFAPSQFQTLYTPNTVLLASLLTLPCIDYA
jgi:hypothetical protein